MFNKHPQTDACVICHKVFAYASLAQHTCLCAKENQIAIDELQRLIDTYKKKRPVSFYGDDSSKKFRSYLSDAIDQERRMKEYDFHQSSNAYSSPESNPISSRQSWLLFQIKRLKFLNVRIVCKNMNNLNTGSASVTRDSENNNEREKENEEEYEEENEEKEEEKEEEEEKDEEEDQEEDEEEDVVENDNGNDDKNGIDESETNEENRRKLYVWSHFEQNETIVKCTIPGCTKTYRYHNNANSMKNHLEKQVLSLFKC
jgi:hypothetical protein